MLAKTSPYLENACAKSVLRKISGSEVSDLYLRVVKREASILIRIDLGNCHNDIVLGKIEYSG